MLLIDNNKERMIHAMIFFVKNTKFCYKTKLFKLLYYFDFEVFRQTGRSVTGLKYAAWPKGPVPTDLFDMMKDNDSDLCKAFSIQEKSKIEGDYIEKDSLVFSLKKSFKFNKKLFSIREQEIMKHFAEVFKEATAKDMIESTHEKNDPWDRVYNHENKKQGTIPYTYILENKSSDTISIDEAEEIEKEDKEMKEIFG